MASSQELGAALQDANVQGFLALIAAGESDAGDPEAYRALFGWRHGNGRVFESFADHPRQAVQTKYGWTSAAGKYQAMCAVPGKVKTDTWGDFIRSMGPHDFSPASQDLFAMWCINRRRALDDVLAGRVYAAISKCRLEWASLPSSPYGQPTQKLSEAIKIYEAYGGVVTDGTPAPAQEVKPMDPISILGVVIPSLINAAPDLIRLFGHGSAIDERNAQVAERVVDVARQVTGAVNEQQAAQMIESNPQMAAQFREAVTQNLDQWMGMTIKLHEMSEASRAKTREFILAYDRAPVAGKFTFLELLSLIFVVVSASGAGWVLVSTEYSMELKGAVIAAILIGGYTGVKEAWFGKDMGQVPQGPQTK